MINIEEILYEKIKRIMSGWDEEGIYAVSFFIYSNELYSFREYDNVSSFEISYNTEEDCGGAGLHSEERWNYAFWRQDATAVIEPRDDSPEMELLFDWYREQGITNIGCEDGDSMDGPVGFPELVELAAKVARRFQDEGFLKEKFGYPIPIIIHDLEYVDCVWKATAYANPNGEAKDFFEVWETAQVQPFPVRPVNELAQDFLNNTEMLEKLISMSPGLSREYILEMLQKAQGKIT